MKELDIINYGNCISASRPDRITTATVWNGRSNEKNGVYPITQLLTGVARVSIKNEGTRHYYLWKLYLSFTPRPHYHRYCMEWTLE
jgi:hypothetical protein